MIYFRTLDTQDEFVQLKAAQILTVILRSVAGVVRAQRLIDFWLLDRQFEIHSPSITTIEPVYQHPRLVCTEHVAEQTRCSCPVSRGSACASGVTPCSLGRTRNHSRVCNLTIILISASLCMSSLRFVEILKRQPGPQMSYQVAFCLWLLSFEQDVAEQINKCVLCIFFYIHHHICPGNTILSLS